MTATVRVARPADLAHLQRLEDEADALLTALLRPRARVGAPTGADRAAAGGFLLVTAEDADGEPVGFAHVLEVDGQAHLEQLSVPAAHGRQGRGRALVEAAQREAARRGCPRMTLRTFADVPCNAPFYRSVGFTPSEPDTAFLTGLVEVERTLGLDALGTRVQMTAALAPVAEVLDALH